MLAILVFIIILGVLIFVHELGHFVVARRNGIRCYEFGFGFPPRFFGIQFIKGERMEKVSEVEEMKVEVTDIKSGDEEILTETVTEKIHKVDKLMPVGRWRIIWGHDDDDENEKRDWDEIEKNNYKRSTIYSLNWIPIGGFVKIKGEDGEHRDDPDSFSSRPAWTRTKVLAAGVAMNFVLAWFLISLGLMIGAPQAVEGNNAPADSKIQIAEIAKSSPAETMGLKIGDEISKAQVAPDGKNISLKNIEEVQNYINSNKGQEVTLKIIRGKEILDIKGTPRAAAPEGQGPLGIAMAETQLVSYPWYEAIWKGLIFTGNLIVTILVAFYGLLKSLIMGQSVGAAVTGPVGIAVLTKDVTNLGLVYILQFAAVLSVNLGIINILPIPALDGGRIFFILIEKIKGKPVSHKVEQAFHTAFFMLLIMLMLAVTFHDVMKLAK
ncbi:MAG: RIP metalloprotease RseP [Parcubacteria group bacterium]